MYIISLFFCNLVHKNVLRVLVFKSVCNWTTSFPLVIIISQSSKVYIKIGISFKLWTMSCFIYLHKKVCKSFANISINDPKSTNWTDEEFPIRKNRLLRAFIYTVHVNHLESLIGMRTDLFDYLEWYCNLDNI